MQATYLISHHLLSTYNTSTMSTCSMTQIVKKIDGIIKEFGCIIIEITKTNSLPQNPTHRYGISVKPTHKAIMHINDTFIHLSMIDRLLWMLGYDCWLPNY